MVASCLGLENLSFTYPEATQPTIKNLSMTIPAGKKSAIIGHNGSGKSSLLLLLDGLYQPQQGRISTQETALQYDRQSLIKWREKIGLAFQDPEQQLVAGTVAEDISYGLCNLGLPESEIEQRLEDAIADWDLVDLAYTPLHHLSLGQKRRVALAGVMALKPDLLLLDEPTAYLDSLKTRNLIAKLEEISAAGTTIIMATHDLNLAYQWADWFFILHQGELVMEGEGKDVFAQKQVLRELELELPLLWEVWENLPFSQNSSKNISPPKTIAELRQFFQAKRK